jgi:phosphoglycolate phosphatase
MIFTSLIFDFDGTLFDTRHAIVATLERTFHVFGKTVPNEAMIWATIRLGITLENTFQILMDQPTKDQVDKMVVRYREIYNGGLGIEKSSPFPGVTSLLRDLREAGNTIVLCSNKGQAAVDSILAHYGIGSVVSLIVAADGAQPTKPNPASFDNRIKPQIGAAASARPLIIGDTGADIRYARAIGAKVCWAAYGYGDPEVCLPLKPDYCINDSLDLRSMFIASNNMSLTSKQIVL